MRFRERSPLVWALWFSLIAHAVLLTLHFQPELKALKDQIPSLKVMLVNSKTQQAPKNADALAQANLDRGGNTDEKRQMKSPLPSVQKMPSTTPQAAEATMQPAMPATPQDAELQRHQQRVAQLEQEAQALMTQLKASQTVTSVQAPPLSQTQAAARKPTPQALNQPVQTQREIMAMQEMAKLEALIAKQQDIYEMRPKRQFIGARTREYRFANYVDQWRQKIEQVGNLNYPEAARTQKLYGKLQLTVAIRADGSIEHIKIQQSSGKRLLDESARRIVQLAAPFPVFPEDIRKDTDVLSITRTWTFSKEDQLSTE